jgi:non-specific serine/threonine protein kinase
MTPPVAPSHDNNPGFPLEATGFVGRETELTRIDALLASARLITVTGVGGVGKTRVALRAATAASARYPDGEYLTDLSALRDPELLPHTVATALGLSGQDPRAAMDTVLGHLRDRGLLLILDTCEHLIDAAATFAEAVLRHAPRMTLLATSRQPLDVPGETVCLIPPLPVPDADALETSGDAVELFAKRAAAVVPGFTVSAANRTDVIELCRHLDGIPLAIELAAVRLRALPLPELAERLDSRLTILSGGRCGTVDRHQTLRAAITWSHDLCSPAERALWARFSIFAGSMGVEAAEEVCAGEDLHTDQILDTVIGLVDKSVLVQEQEGGGTRYRMLDTLREFGAEQLAASGAETAVRDRLLARYLAKARYFGAHFLDDDQLDRYRELRAEHASIRAALEYALDEPPGRSARARYGAELAASLYGYWQISGLLQEGRYWLAKVADRFTGPTAERAWALVVRGYLGALQGRPGEAVADANEGTAVAVRLGEELISARGYLYLNLALTFAGRFEEAAKAGDEARRGLEALEDRIGLLTLDTQLGHLANSTGNFVSGMSYAVQGLRRFGKSSEHWLHGYLHTTAALALLFQPGQEAKCAEAIGKALRDKHELGDIVGIALAFEVYGWLAARADRARRTALLLGAAAPLWERAGGRLAGAEVLERYHEQAVGAARGILGDKRFDALHAQGSRRALDDIVSLAYGDTDELNTDPGPKPPADGLTSRELEIAALVAEGLANREIADRMVISKRTVDAHVEHIFGKLKISSRVQLTLWVRQRR